MSKKTWKKGRGKLGSFDPLMGIWQASSDSPMGPLTCRRSLSRMLGDKFIKLEAEWSFGSTVYREFAIIGVDGDGVVRFWSFTNDGKTSTGVLADVTDIHPEAVGFEANMPAGTARMAYWPDVDGGFVWAVENKTKKGWNRMVEHHYKSIS